MDTQPSSLSGLVEGMSQVLHPTDIADFQPIFPRAALFRFLLSFLHRVSSLDLLQIKFGPSPRVDIRQVLWPLLTSRSSLLLLAFARLRDLSSYGHTLSILCLPDLPWAVSDSYRTSISHAILSSPLGLVSDFCPSDQPDVCRRLPADSVSRRTPLPLAVTFPLSGRFRDLHPLEYVRAGRT